MDWKDLLITQAIATVIAVVNDPKGRGRFRKALLKIFRVLAAEMKRDAEFRQAAEDLLS